MGAPSPAGASKPERRFALSALLIVGCGLLAYSNAFTNLFVGLDGKESIRDNPHILHLWPLSEALSLPMWRVLIDARETPAIAHRYTFSLSLALTNFFFGLNPKAHHAVNLALHIGAALWLFATVRYAARKVATGFTDNIQATNLALASALLWVVHPLQTESVTYIVQRSELLMGFFLFACMYCAIRGRDADPPWLWHTGAIVACALGTGGKQTAALAPLLIGLYDYTATPPASGRRFRPVFYVLLALPSIVIPAAMGGKIQQAVDFAWILDYAAKQPRVILHYLRLVVWPDDLYVYVNTRVFDLDSPLQVLLPAAILSVAALLSLYGLWQRSWLGYLALWFFVTLAPTSTFVPIPDSIQEHRMYVPLAGLCVLAVLAGRWLAAHSLPYPLSRNLPAVALAAILLALGVRTHARNWDYHHEFAMIHPADVHGNFTILADHASSRPELLQAEAARARGTIASADSDSHDIAYAHFILALEAQRSGSPALAKSQLEQLLTVDPQFAYAEKELGVVLRDLGDLTDARVHLERAVQLDPSNVYAYKELALVLQDLGDADAARKQLERALRIEPSFGEGMLELGVLAHAEGDTERAAQYFRQALSLRPDLYEAHFELGLVLEDEGDPEGAITQYQQALEIEPAFADAHVRLGVLRRDQGDFSQARDHFEAAIVAVPATVDAYVELGILWREQGEFESAEKSFTQALRLQPDSADAENELGVLWRNRGDVARAAAHFERAVRLQPDLANVHSELGWIRLREGHATLAQEHFRTALAADPELEEARAGLAQAASSPAAATPGTAP